MDFQESLQPITRVSDGSVILTQEGNRICFEGDWNATNEEEIKLSRNRIMFLCSSTNISYNHTAFWTQRIDNTTVSATQKQSNDRLIIKKTDTIKGIDKSLFICAHYIEGKNDHDSVLLAVTFVANKLQFPPCCVICNQLVSKEDSYHYKSRLYHKKCIKCSVCQKELYQNNDFVEIDGMFICQQHNDEYSKDPDNIPQEIVEKYCNEVKKNFVETVFGDDLIDKEDISSYSPDEIFISTETLKKNTVKQRPFDDFIPTISIHFEKEIEEIDFIQLEKEILGPNVKVLDKKRGSTILKIALLEKDMLGPDAKKKCDQYVKKLKAKVNSPLGQKIVGNIKGEPEVKIPDKQSSWFNKPSINRLPNKISITDDELEKYKEEIFKKLTNANDIENMKFLFEHQKLLDEMEEQLRKDLEDNSFEMVVIDYSLIADKYYDNYEKIKRLIPENEKHECFYYHGSRLGNHMLIVKTHFLMPGVDNIEHKTDDGYYGQGIYATDNPYYALMYSNDFKELKINEKGYILCCRSIYNETKIRDLSDNVEYFGKPIKPDIKDAFGIHRAFVGDSTKPYRFLPIDKSMIEQNKFCANEIIFPNKYQFIPFGTFTIMKKDSYVIWKDDNMDNKENTEIVQELSNRLEINIYQKKTVDDALELIKKKKYAIFKLVTNAGKDKSGKELIEKARELIGSNFVCLVFANDPNHMEWISNMENVLFTTKKEHFIEFAEARMTLKSIKGFISRLEKSTKFKFNINDEQLLKFPRINQVYIEEEKKALCNIA